MPEPLWVRVVSFEFGDNVPLNSLTPLDLVAVDPKVDKTTEASSWLKARAI